MTFVSRMRWIFHYSKNTYPREHMLNNCEIKYRKIKLQHDLEQDQQRVYNHEPISVISEKSNIDNPSSIFCFVIISKHSEFC